MHTPRLPCLRSTQYVAISPPGLLHISDVRRKRHMWVRTHSFATGPVMAEPFISPLGFTMTPALSYKCEVRVWSLAEYAYLKVEEETITSTPGFALTDDDGRHRCTYARVSGSSRATERKSTYSSCEALACPSSQTPRPCHRHRHQEDDSDASHCDRVL